MKRLFSKKANLFLLAVILTTIGASAMFFEPAQKPSGDHIAQPTETVESTGDLSLGQFHQVATKNGENEWTLEASSARILEAKKEVEFSDLSMVFYMSNGRRVILKADEGQLKTETNDIEVAGDVVITSDKYRLNTSRLKYRHKHRTLATKEPVIITGPNGSLLIADQLMFDLKTNKTQFKGRVEGFFREKFDL
jgi:LPS export ABC transporter protein LptC